MSPKKHGTTMKDWYSACEQFVNLTKTNTKLSQAKFLDSGLNGDKVTRTEGDYLGFHWEPHLGAHLAPH
jgi:hypothetical protein